MSQPPPEKIKVPTISSPADSLMSKTPTTSLANACYHGDLGRVQEIIKRDPALVHEIDEEGRTAIHFAAYQSAVNVCLLLMRSVLESDVVVPFKRTLHDLKVRTEELGKSLVSEEDHRLSQQWLDEEKERQCLDFVVQCTTVAAQVLSRPDASGCTPLHYAATTRDDTIGDLLRYPETFAHKQLLSGSLRALVKQSGSGHGTKEDSTQQEERERREERLRRRTRRLTRTVWRRAVDARDLRRNTTLHFAACSGSTSAVRHLIRLGADHRAKNDVSQTPLDVAEDKTSRAAIMRLPQAVDEECDRKRSSSSAGGKSDDAAASASSSSASSSSSSSIIQSLLDNGELVNAQTDIKGETALHRACSRGAPDVVQVLLDENGADKNATDANGWTCLHCCGYFATKEHGVIARNLLDRDVDVDARTLRGRTPLHLVVVQEHFTDQRTTTTSDGGGSGGGGGGGGGAVDENTRTHRRMPERKKSRTKLSSMAVVNMVELLARRGANLEAIDVSGRTALHFAARRGDSRVVHSLLLLGAQAYTLTRNRSNILHIAVQSANRSVVRLLVRFDAEKRLLKQGRDAANRIPADVAPVCFFFFLVLLVLLVLLFFFSCMLISLSLSLSPCLLLFLSFFLPRRINAQENVLSLCGNRARMVN